MPTTPSPFQRLQWIVIPKVGATLPIIALWLFFVLSPANAGLSEGVEAYNSAHYSQAFNELLPLAKQGNSQAQRLIGEMYRFGLGTSLDLQQGVEWTKKSAGQGDADAQTDLGLLLSGLTKDSNLQPLDKKQGVKWMTQAANGGNAKAQYMLGLIYLGELKDMSGFPKNKKRGLNFLSQSANSSDLEYRKKSAQLLRLIYSGKTEHGNYDFEKELHWFEVEFGLSRTRKAAETGGAKAAMKLAYALSQHSWRPHTVKLKKEIMKWYAQAAAGGVLTGNVVVY
jgi:TPR repeat protein